ncbi:MAG: GNAT family N-acetyltransferase, partial [Phycisphaerales bacterium JB041]
MLFVSGGVGGGPPEASRDRATAIREAVRLARDGYGERAHLIQALAQPRERWAAASFETAGLRRLTDLHYLAKSLQLRDSVGPVAAGEPVSPLGGGLWPPGIRVRAMDSSPESERDLRCALEASYEDTLDCPELAGMRTLDDIIAAHRDVGAFDPAMWWLVERENTLAGCVLLNACPAQACVELVYVGISPLVRGMGLGRLLLQRAIAAAAPQGRELRCAVDARNSP